MQAEVLTGQYTAEHRQCDHAYLWQLLSQLSLDQIWSLVAAGTNRLSPHMKPCNINARLDPVDPWCTPQDAGAPLHPRLRNSLDPLKILGTHHGHGASIVTHPTSQNHVHVAFIAATSLMLDYLGYPYL
jgi:hypothetical protein